MSFSDEYYKNGYEEVSNEVVDMYPKEERSIIKMMIGITSTAIKAVAKKGETSLRVGKALIPAAENSKTLRETGKSLRDLREVAGLTIQDLSDALELKDQSLLEAVENGTATLSFDLTLRLAAVLARHDPVPFIIRAIRTYNPEAWKILEDWGVGRFPIYYERERQFINIFRSKDAARDLSHAGFERVLDFTRAGFDMALHYALKNEGLIDDEEDENDEEDEGHEKEDLDKDLDKQ